MMRSDVGVTDSIALELTGERDPEPERIVATPCSNALFARCDALCFLIMSNRPNFEFNIMDTAQLASLETGAAQIC